MTDTPDNWTDIERALAELGRAERAAVFRTTPVDTRGLLYSSHEAQAPWIYRYRRVFAAAAIVLAAGVWVTMFTVQLGGLRRAKFADVGRPGDSRANLSVQNCVAGPGEALPAECVAFDKDGDGDVDLGDLSFIQLASNR